MITTLTPREDVADVRHGRPPPETGDRAVRTAAPVTAHAAGPCRVLLICDNDHTSSELRRILGDEIAIDQVFGHPLAETSLRLDIHEVKLGRIWDVDLHERHYHLGIVATSSVSPLLALAEHPALRAATAAMLYLVDMSFDTALAGKDRQPGDRILAAPFSSLTLRAEIERSLLAVRASATSPNDDERCLTFLDAVIARGQRVIKPLMVSGAAGPTYPVIAEHFGPGVNHAAILERLVGLGICTRSAIQRLRTCPTCASHQMSWSEACTRCGSPDFVRETMIHHLTCGHRDSAAAFTRGQTLVCPKCGWSLRQAGRDYERPDDCYCCRACNAVATEARVDARCLCCQTVSTPQQVGHTLLHTYELTAKADEAVRANDLGGHHMAHVLRNHDTGLYPTSFFLYTLERELDRRRQHHTPVSVVALRAGFLAGLRLTSVERYAEQVQALWRAATHDLSSLDVPCVWDDDIVVILLPDTPLAGATAVVRRIQDAFVEAGHDVDDAPLTLVAVEADDRHADAEALVHDAVTRLGAEGATISDVLVLEEEADDSLALPGGPRA